MADTEAQIIHYKKYLTKYFEKPKEEKILYVFQKLEKLDVTLELLQSTGIGKTVNSFRKHEAGVGEKARSLVAKWKQLVSTPSSDAPADPARSSTPGLQCETVSETTYGPGSSSGRVQHRLDEVIKTPYLDGTSQSSPELPSTGVKVKSEPEIDKSTKCADSKPTKPKSHGDHSHHKDSSHSSNKEQRKKDADKHKRERDRNKRERDNESSTEHHSSKRKKTERHPGVEPSGQSGKTQEPDLKLVKMEKPEKEDAAKKVKTESPVEECQVPQKKIKKESNNEMNETSGSVDMEKSKGSSEKCASSKSDKASKEGGGRREKHHKSKSSHHHKSSKDNNKSSKSLEKSKSSHGHNGVKLDESQNTEKDKVSNSKVHIKEEKNDEDIRIQKLETDKVHKDDKHDSKDSSSPGREKNEKVDSGHSKEKSHSSGHSKKHHSDKPGKHAGKSGHSQSSSSGQKQGSSSGHKSSHSSSSSSSKSKSGKSVSSGSHSKKEGKSDKKSSRSSKEKEKKLVVQEFDMFAASNTLSDEDGGGSDAEIPNGASSSHSAKKDKSPHDVVNHSAKSTKPKSSTSSAKSASPAVSNRNGEKMDATCKSSFTPPVPKPISTMTLCQDEILSPLPEITPNYKPLPYMDLDLLNRKKGDDIHEEVGSKKNTRTQVYSGRRNIFLSAVPSLFDACIQVLRENIDALDYVGGVPYDVLKPVLDVCSPSQLYTIEDANPQFIGETDELWEAHCRKDFRKEEPSEFESWRELYIRMHDARDAKLKALTASISASMAKALPVRSTKLAYVDVAAKAPRDVRRRQRIHGTAGPVGKQDPLQKLSSHGGAPSQSRGPIHRASNPNISSSLGRARSEKPVKIIAPMMRKTLRLMKGLPRR